MSVKYVYNKTKWPVVFINSPTLYTEEQMPFLFVRASNNELLEFDARPFSARDEARREVSTVLHMNGRKLKSNPAGDISAVTIAPKGSGPEWDINVSYSYSLSHRLGLGAGRWPINLLKTPISLSAPGPARHRLNAQWTVGGNNVGLSGTMSAAIGGRTQPAGGINSRSIRYL